MDARALKKMMADAIGGVRQALRGRLQRAAGAKQVILVQSDGLAGEQFNDAELFQQPGLRSIPIAGMQTIIVPLGGRSANGVVIAMSNGALFITDLQPGEVALFNENDGVANSVVLRNGRLVEINCANLTINASEAVTITAPTVTMTTTTTTIEADTATIDAGTTNVSGNTNIGGDTTMGGSAQVAQTLRAAVDLVAAGKSLKAHVHNGVSAGPSNTGLNQ